MVGFGLHSLSFGGALTLLLVSAPVPAQSPLQHVADKAALAAVDVLRAGGDAHEASAAAQQMIANSGAKGEVKASPEVRTVTVKVLQPSTDAQPAAKTPAVSTARYVPPEQPANWQWAARQRFALKPMPVVVGAACMQGCDPSR